MSRKLWLYLTAGIAVIATAAVAYFYTPTLEIRRLEVEEVVLLSVLPSPTLWDMGFTSDSTSPPTWSWAEGLFPGTHAMLIGETFDRVKSAIGPAPARYLIRQGPGSGDGLYSLSIRNAAGDGLHLRVMSWEDEAAGRFVGFTGQGDSTGQLRWFVYYNPELGKTLKDMRQVEVPPIRQEPERLYLHHLSNGDLVGRGLIIEDIDFEQGRNTAVFTLSGELKAEGWLGLNERDGQLTFSVAESECLPIIVIEGDHDTVEYSPRFLTFRNIDAVLAETLEEIKDGQLLSIVMTVTDIRVNFHMGTCAGGATCELVSLGN